MSVPLRVRLLAALVARATGPVGEMSPERRHALRHPDAPRFVTDLVNGRRAAGVTATDLTVPGRGGDIAVRVYRPDAPSRSDRPLVVNVPGGGWMFAGLHSSDWLCSRLAAALDAVVVTVAHRLAPEHPAPAALEDALVATTWVSRHARELGARGGPLALVGDSSGGNLAAGVALAARDSGGPAIAAQVLLYPITDLTVSGRSVVELDHAPFLTSEDLRSYVAGYLGSDGNPRDPLLSPLWAPDLSGLPPALVVSADSDPLRDDARRYAARLSAAGVPVDYVEYSDTPHGFLSFPRACAAAEPAVARVVAVLRSALSVPAPAPADGR